MYIDPGIGSLLLQGVLAGIVGTAFVARQKIRRFFGRLTGKSAPGGGEASATGEASAADPAEPPARRPE